MFQTQVLDKGFVRVVDKLGTDLTPVNAARCSFGKSSTTLEDKDIKLLRYLKKHKHWSPVRHMMVTFHIKAPEFVMRQVFRHCIGIDVTSGYVCKDYGWSELSQRYVEIEDFYYPAEWRKQHESSKQASDGPLSQDVQKGADLIFFKAMNQQLAAYQHLLSIGVAKEEARILLPLNAYTECYWTASFQAIMNFIELRDDDHAQWEIRQYAIAIKNAMLELFPVNASIWLEPATV